MKKNWSETVRPIAVLCIICLIVGAGVATVNALTFPIIEQAEAQRAAETRRILLPQATEFIEIPCEIETVRSVYRDEGGSGYIITVANRGYGGDVISTVAIDTDGKVVALTADVSTETTGIGTKAGLASYTDMYVGLHDSAASIDTITGATYSSSAVRTSVSTALDVYHSIAGGEEG